MKMDWGLFVRLWFAFFLGGVSSLWYQAGGEGEFYGQALYVVFFLVILFYSWKHRVIKEVDWAEGLDDV